MVNLPKYPSVKIDQAKKALIRWYMHFKDAVETNSTRCKSKRNLYSSKSRGGGHQCRPKWGQLSPQLPFKLYRRIIFVIRISFMYINAQTSLEYHNLEGIFILGRGDLVGGRNVGSEFRGLDTTSLVSLHTMPYITTMIQIIIFLLYEIIYIILEFLER